jgi:hypothetical protein
MKRVGRIITGLALSVGMASIAVPADARSWRHHGGGDDTALAIGAGIVGLGIGVALASDHGGGRYYSYDDGPYYGSYYGSYYGPPPYRAYYGYRSYRPGYYGSRHRYRGGCYTRRVYDPYIGRRVKVRYCR